MSQHTVMVNGHAVEPGCWVEGHWGQYGPDHLADQAETLGWGANDPTDDPRHWRYLADNEANSFETEVMIWERHVETADAIEAWLNENTAPNCTECGGPMYATSDGFYRHIAHPSVAATEANPDGCQIAATDTVQRFIWHWRDGEFFLSPICDDADDCTDETCAHWD